MRPPKPPVIFHDSDTGRIVGASRELIDASRKLLAETRPYPGAPLTPAATDRPPHESEARGTRSGRIATS